MSARDGILALFDVMPEPLRGVFLAYVEATVQRDTPGAALALAVLHHERHGPVEGARRLRQFMAEHGHDEVTAEALRQLEKVAAAA